MRLERRRRILLGIDRWEIAPDGWNNNKVVVVGAYVCQFCDVPYV